MPEPLDELLATDSEARRRALDVRQSFIVQAPAGSGKTELLIQRYLCLLAIVRRPEEVLAITFTQKAADEMRERVIDALMRAANDEHPELAHEQTTLNAARSVLARDDELDWELAANPESLRIQTLDAFCAAVTRSQPLTSGLGPQPTIVQDATASALYRRAAVATLDWLVETGEFSSAVEQVLMHLDNDSGAYVENVAAMLAKREQWLSIVGHGHVEDPAALRRSLEAGIERTIGQHLVDLRGGFVGAPQAGLVEGGAYAARTLIAAGRSSDITALRDAEALPGTASEDLPAWRGFAELLLTRSGAWRRTVNEPLGFPAKDAGEKRAWLSLLGELNERDDLRERLHAVRRLPAPAYADSQWEVLLALFKVLPVAVGELKRLFAEQGAGDFVEVALSAAAALGSSDEPGQATLRLDHQIQHVLIDEMQDTSLLQYQLLESLTAGWQTGDGRTFFCVGDPMQSIYRFRNAEVGYFLRAQQTGFAEVTLQPLTLRRNFRSTEALVSWFNAAFSQTFPPEADLNRGAVPYTASVAVAPKGGSGQEFYPLVDASIEHEAQRTALLIEQLTVEAPSDEVAVLVRSRAQLPELLAALRGRGLAFDALEIDRLSDLSEIIDLQVLTRCCLHPGDRAAWLGLLRGPFVGLSWTDLHSLTNDAPHLPVWDLMTDADHRGRLSEAGQASIEQVIPILDRTLHAGDEQGLRYTVERTWYQLGGPAFLQSEEELTNVYRFLDVIEHAATNRALRDADQLQGILAEERVSRFGGEDCRLRIMTMHKAKGLQFDHVVLPYLGRYSRASTQSVLSWHRQPSAGSEILMSPIGARHELERDPLHRFIENEQRIAERFELDRLLYVACTRARKTLHLLAHVERDGAGQPKAPHAASLLHRLWPVVEGTVAAECDRAAEHSESKETAVRQWLAPPSRRAAEPIALPVPAAVPGRAPRSTAATGRTVEYRWVGEQARLVGVLVHRWLERFAAGLDGPADHTPSERDKLTRTWAVTAGAAAEEVDAICRRVQLAVTSTLSDGHGAWILGGPGEAELALTGIYAGKLQSIVIDRVRIDGSTHWVIDYKTGSHEGGNLETFLAEEVRRYTPQLAVYADLYRAYSNASVVRAALYFPLLGEFREIACRAD